MNKWFNSTDMITSKIKQVIDFIKNNYWIPIINFFEKIIDVLLDLVKSIQNIRVMFVYIRDMTETYLLDIGNMFYAYATKLSVLFNRIMQINHKIMYTFETMYYSLKYTQTTLQSISNSPPFAVMKFFAGEAACFHKNTNIQLEVGTKKISEIKVGDKLKNGKVTGIHIFSGKNINMYNYKDIIVSGDHLVYENKWIRIKNSNMSILTIPEYKIYCLTTSSGKIEINDILFSDYMEIKDTKQMKDIFNIAMIHMNNKVFDFDMNIEKVSGFQKDTFISENKKISELKINDKLDENNYVIGINKVRGKNIKLYKYNNIIASGNVIIQINNESRCMKEIGECTNYKKSRLYHIHTLTGQLTINNTIFKDYDSYQNNESNEKIYNILNNYTENKLNIKV